MQHLDIRQPTPHVAEVWLNRPDVRNAFNEEVLSEVTEAFETLSADPALRVVVFSGHGKAFCAGADLNWMRRVSAYDEGQNHADAGRLAKMLWTIYTCPVPVIARIHGDCYAGGFGLAAACDIVVAADTVTFSISEVKLGLVPATISPYVLRAMGTQAARRYFVTGERFNATQAKEFGFVHELCTVEAIDAKVSELVAHIVGNGPQAVRACKRLIQDVAGRQIDDELRADTIKRIADIRASEEGREGVQSFLEKRKAGWMSG
jgi:methylglutaconyl-CoA hydratase